MSKGTALVKSKKRYQKLISVFPDREDFYLTKIAEVDSEIARMKVCRRCGRPLKDDHAIELGYGKECWAKTDTDMEEMDT